MHARMLLTMLPRMVVPSLHAMRERLSHAALLPGLTKCTDPAKI